MFSLINKIIIVCILSLVNCYTQTVKINNVCHDKLLCDSTGSIENGLKYPTIYRVRIFQLEEDTTIYDIHFTILSSEIINIEFTDTVDGLFVGWAEWNVDDMNFDGYLDIRLAFAVGMHGDPIYSYYLYNPRIRKFEENSDYLDKLRGDINFDQSSKTIIEKGEYWGGDLHTWQNIYMCNNNKLIIIDEFDEHYWEIGDSTFSKRYRSKIIDGQNVVLEDTIIIHNSSK